MGLDMGVRHAGHDATPGADRWLLKRGGYFLLLLLLLTIMLATILILVLLVSNVGDEYGKGSLSDEVSMLVMQVPEPIDGKFASRLPLARICATMAWIIDRR